MPLLNKDSQIQVQVEVKGLVQGVFYRYGTKQKASTLNIMGWIRNNEDGN